MVSLNTDILTLLVVIPLGNVAVWSAVSKSTSPDKKELFHSNNTVVVATEITEVVEMVDYGHILFAINLEILK